MTTQTVLTCGLAVVALAGCAHRCIVKQAEAMGFGDHALDCSHAKVEKTDQVCDGYEVFSLSGCRLETGEVVGLTLAVDPRSCFARSPAGLCFE